MPKPSPRQNGELVHSASNSMKAWQPLHNRDVDLLALDEALERLTKIDPQRSRIVELRFFGGLSNEESAEVLGVSPATIQRQWSGARAWLFTS